MGRSLLLLWCITLPALAEPGKPAAFFDNAAVKWQWCHLVQETLKPHCHNQPVDKAMKCCDLCVWKKACGNGCIEILEPCSQPKGCACNTLELPRIPASELPKSACCVTCWQGKPCGDKCIPKDQTCSSKPGCACAPTAKNSNPNPK